MARHAFTADGYLAWPERCPVVGPLAGAALALCGVVVSVIEGDWIAATVFVIPAGILVAVAGRNRKAWQAQDQSEAIRADGMTPSNRSRAPDR